jgi:hypothetical protein
MTTEAVIPVQPDTFSLVATLLTAVVDVRDCQKRLADLKAATDACEHAKLELVQARADHDAKLNTDLAALAERKAALDKREHSLMGREGKLVADQELLRAQQAEVDRKNGRFESIGGAAGITREFVPGYARDDSGDAHVKTSVDGDIERVPNAPPAATIRRTVHRPRPGAAL